MTQEPIVRIILQSPKRLVLGAYVLRQEGGQAVEKDRQQRPIFSSNAIGCASCELDNRRR